MLSLLGGRVRLALLRRLAHGPCTVTALAASIGESVGLVSHNLRQLRDAGLVERTAQSRTRIYRLGTPFDHSVAGELHLRIPAGAGLIDLQLPTIRQRTLVPHSRAVPEDLTPKTAN
ncbi:MAG: helix-turn-helix domain-containing protein [Phycisphaerales bacterium]|nr:helix-turn-helix domain-containing protein [Phycisphaerales bacterium]